MSGRRDLRLVKAVPIGMNVPRVMSATRSKHDSPISNGELAESDHMPKGKYQCAGQPSTRNTQLPSWEYPVGRQ